MKFNSKQLELNWQEKKIFALGLEDIGHLLAVTDYELEFENVFISRKTNKITSFKIS